MVGTLVAIPEEGHAPMLPDSRLDGFKGMGSSFLLDGLEFDLCCHRAAFKRDFCTVLLISFEQAQAAVLHAIHTRPPKQPIRTGRNSRNGESQIAVGYPFKDLL